MLLVTMPRGSTGPGRQLYPACTFCTHWIDAHFPLHATGCNSHCPHFWIPRSVWRNAGAELCQTIPEKSERTLWNKTKNLGGRTWLSPFPELCHLLKEMQSEAAPRDWMSLQNMIFFLSSPLHLVCTQGCFSLGLSREEQGKEKMSWCSLGGTSVH